MPSINISYGESRSTLRIVIATLFTMILSSVPIVLNRTKLQKSLLGKKTTQPKKSYPFKKQTSDLIQGLISQNPITLKKFLPVGLQESPEIRFLNEFRSAFPEGKISVVKLIRDSDFPLAVTAILRFSGRQDGTFQGIPPSNQTVTFTRVFTFFWQKTRVTSINTVSDEADLLNIALQQRVQRETRVGQETRIPEMSQTPA